MTDLSPLAEAAVKDIARAWYIIGRDHSDTGDFETLWKLAEDLRNARTY